MSFFYTFLIAFFFSFIGSIPPATINLMAVQLGFENKIQTAWRLSIGASMIEYFYAWMAVKFEGLITSMPVVAENFQLLTAIVMLTLGALNLWFANKPSEFSEKFNDSGFRRGVILGILNPLAIPYWIGVTASLESQHWVDLSTDLHLHSYLLGVLLGGFILLITVSYLAKKIISNFQQSALLKKIPGFAMLGLGTYSLVRYLIVINFK